MMHPIAWMEAARPRGGEDVELEDFDSDVEGEVGTSSTVGNGKGKADGEGSTTASLEDNKCYLVWEGTLRNREYSGFKAKSYPTDRDAKEFLGERLKH